MVQTQCGFWRRTPSSIQGSGEAPGRLKLLKDERIGGKEGKEGAKAQSVAFEESH
jgi:hypothetical protein